MKEENEITFQHDLKIDQHFRAVRKEDKDYCQGWIDALSWVLHETYEEKNEAHNND